MNRKLGSIKQFVQIIELKLIINVLTTALHSVGVVAWLYYTRPLPGEPLFESGASSFTGTDRLFSIFCSLAPYEQMYGVAILRSISTGFTFARVGGGEGGG